MVIEVCSVDMCAAADAAVIPVKTCELCADKKYLDEAKNRFQLFSVSSAFAGISWFLKASYLMKYLK